jgi:hypothetical protein
MKVLLNNIENSEDNNPLLTAALAEVEKLNNKLSEIKYIVETDGPIKEISENGSHIVLQGYQELQAKMAIIAKYVDAEY